MALVLLSSLSRKMVRDYCILGRFSANDTQCVVEIYAHANDMVEAGYHVSFNAGCADLIWG